MSAKKAEFIRAVFIDEKPTISRIQALKKEFSIVDLFYHWFKSKKIKQVNVIGDKKTMSRVRKFIGLNLKKIGVLMVF